MDWKSLIFLLFINTFNHDIEECKFYYFAYSFMCFLHRFEIVLVPRCNLGLRRVGIFKKQIVPTHWYK
jgi:hypothetical protein